MGAMKVLRVVKRITFNPSEANTGETLNVHVPKLNENEVLVPGSLALRFGIDRFGGHANNFLVHTVSRALVSQLVVKFDGTTFEDTVDFDVYKTFSDLFLPGKSVTTWCPRVFRAKICARSAQARETKKTSGIEAEKKLHEICGTKCRISLDHQILTDHGVFYPQALYNDLLFEVTLASEAASL